MKTQKLYNKILDSYAIWNGDAWNDENISGAYFYSLEKAANNGYYPVEENSDREKAIEWYNQLESKEKRRLCHLHFNHVIIDPNWNEEAKQMIEQIWRKAQ